MARLKQGPASKAELVTGLPREAGKTDDQRAGDCANALTRLRLKQVIKQVDEGWAIA